MGFLKSLTKAFYKVADPVLTTIAHPIQVGKAITSKKTTVKQVQKKFFSQPKGVQAVQYVTGALTLGGGVATGVAAKAGAISLKSGAIASVAKKVIPKTFKGKVVAAVAAPIVVSAVVSQPKKVAKTVQKAPTELAKFGTDVAEFAADPSIETAKDIIKESPVITAGIAVVGTATAARIAAPIVGGIIASDSSKVVVKPTPSVVTPPIASIPAAAPVKQPSVESLPAPVTPELVDVKKTPTTKRRRRTKKAVKRPISQRVNVIVSNRSTGTTTKNYLYGRVLA